jgi:hypothetical protein
MTTDQLLPSYDASHEPVCVSYQANNERNATAFRSSRSVIEMYTASIEGMRALGCNMDIYATLDEARAAGWHITQRPDGLLIVTGYTRSEKGMGNE